MDEYTLYLITIGAVAVAIATIFISVSLYNKKKIALQAEEKEMKQRIAKAERDSAEKLRLADDELQKRTAELENRITQFNNEQKLRDDLSKKTDREVVVEMHVKTIKIFDALNSIEQKLAGVKDYSEQLVILEQSLTDSIGEMAYSLETSVSSLESDLRSSFGDMDSTIRNAISANMKALDESDVRKAVSDALDYDCYFFKSSLEDIVKNAVESEISSKMSDIEGKLSDIESSISQLG